MSYKPPAPHTRKCHALDTILFTGRCRHRLIEEYYFDMRLESRTDILVLPIPTLRGRDITHRKCSKWMCIESKKIHVINTGCVPHCRLHTSKIRVEARIKDNTRHNYGHGTIRSETKKLFAVSLMKVYNSVQFDNRKLSKIYRREK